jgi:hypothetical protein
MCKWALLLSVLDNTWTSSNLAYAGERVRIEELDDFWARQWIFGSVWAIIWFTNVLASPQRPKLPRNPRIGESWGVKVALHLCHDNNCIEAFIDTVHEQTLRMHHCRQEMRSIKWCLAFSAYVLRTTEDDAMPPVPILNIINYLAWPSSDCDW